MKTKTLILISVVVLWLFFILTIWLAVYNPAPDPEDVVESQTEITLTTDNWLDYFTMECREQMTRTEYADKGISPGIKQEFFLVLRYSRLKEGNISEKSSP